MREFQARCMAMLVEMRERGAIAEVGPFLTSLGAPNEIVQRLVQRTRARQRVDDVAGQTYWNSLWTRFAKEGAALHQTLKKLAAEVVAAH